MDSLTLATYMLAFFTFALVIVTGLYTYVTYRNFQETQKSTENLDKLTEAITELKNTTNKVAKIMDLTEKRIKFLNELMGYLAPLNKIAENLYNILLIQVTSTDWQVTIAEDLGKHFLKVNNQEKAAAELIEKSKKKRSIVYEALNMVLRSWTR